MIRQFLQRLFAPSCEEETNRVICDAGKCALCGKCQAACPANAVSVNARARLYYSYRCRSCGRCVAVCPARALAFSGAEIKAGCLVPALA